VAAADRSGQPRPVSSRSSALLSGAHRERHRDHGRQPTGPVPAADLVDRPGQRHAGVTDGQGAVGPAGEALGGTQQPVSEAGLLGGLPGARRHQFQVGDRRRHDRQACQISTAAPQQGGPDRRLILRYLNVGF
jgi:hypothetical protein